MQNIITDEESRVASLLSYEIMDTLPEAVYDRITELASYICNKPIALISLLDHERQWFKSKVGIDASETPKDISFCQHAIKGDEYYEIKNASLDDQYKDNPLVTGDPNIRFYGGIPLKNSDGHALGTLCVISDQPGSLTADQRKALRNLADQLLDLLDARREYNHLIRSKESAEKFFDFSLDIMCVASVDGFFKKVSPMFKTVLGYEYEELLNVPFTDFIHPNDVADTFKVVETLSQGKEIIDFVNRYRAKDGSYKWFSWRSTPDLETGELYAIARDVTDDYFMGINREAELDAIDRSIIRTSSYVDGTLHEFNSKLINLIGYDQKEISGKRIEDFLFDFDVTDYQSEVLLPISKGNVVEKTLRLAAKNGEEKWIQSVHVPVKDKDGVVSKQLMIATDVSEQIRWQKIIQDQKQRLDNVINGTDLGTWEWNIQKNELVINDRWAEMLGYSIDELVPINADTWFNNIHPEDKAISDRLLNEHFENKGEYFDHEVRMQHKNGQWIWVHNRGKLNTHTADGQPQWMFGTLQEISDRKKAEIKLERTLQELDQFAYVVSHDLKAPLRAISTLATFIEEDLEGKLDKDSQHNLELMRNRATRLEHLINDILAYSRIGKAAARKEKVHVNDLIDEIVGNLNCPTNIKIEVQKAFPDLQIQKVFLFQVLSNLISNAIKYNDNENGIIEIGYDSSSTGELALFVKDNGPGIDPAYHHKVFQVFQTIEKTKNPDSTGIGLSTVKKIIEEIGGHITLDSTEGNGAMFTIILPKSYLADRQAWKKK